MYYFSHLQIILTVQVTVSLETRVYCIFARRVNALYVVITVLDFTRNMYAMYCNMNVCNVLYL